MARSDPIEAIVERALDAVGIAHTNPSHDPADPCVLDFRLTDSGVYIEVKQFHSERSARQLASATDVILIQGRSAALTFARLVNPGASSDVKE